MFVSSPCAGDRTVAVDSLTRFVHELDHDVDAGEVFFD